MPLGAGGAGGERANGVDSLGGKVRQTYPRSPLAASAFAAESSPHRAPGTRWVNLEGAKVSDSFGTALVLTRQLPFGSISRSVCAYKEACCMHVFGPVARHVGLIALAVGVAGAVVAATSFALFTSAATPQKDTFTSGTVLLGQANAPLNCVVQNIEPGDSGTCVYKLTYGGSLNAWVGLSVTASAVATATYTPTGSITPIGGEALLGEGGKTGSDATNALRVSLTDTLGNSGTLALPKVTCPKADSSAVTSAEGSGVLGSSTACHGSAMYLLANTGNTGPNTNNNPADSWGRGTTDTITLDWHLPLNALNTYQGGSAEIRLQAQAVQASNNPLSSQDVPASGWGGPAPVVPPPSGAQLSLSSPKPFGEVLVGATSAVETFTVTNTGGSTSGVPYVALTGAEYQQFSKVANDCASPLPPGGTCTVQVQFAPQQAGRSSVLKYPAGGELLGEPTYSPITDQATLKVSAGGTGAEATLTGTTNWPCMTFYSGFKGIAGCNLFDKNVPLLSNLDYADLGGADLGYATLYAVSLDGANLDSAVLSFAVADYAHLNYADLGAADLKGAFLRHAQLQNAILYNANLSDAFLSHANLDGAGLVNANLTNADLYGASLRGATLVGAIWNNTRCPDGTNSNGDGGTCVNNLG